MTALGPDDCADAMLVLHDKILAAVPAGPARELAEDQLSRLLHLTADDLSDPARAELITATLKEETMPVLDMAHVRHAVEQVGDPDHTYAYVTGPGDTRFLSVMLPSMGAAAVFASALTASLVIDAVACNGDGLTPATAADRAAADALEIMAHASNSWENKMADKGGVEAGYVLIVYFPGVTITGATPEETPGC